MHPCFLYAHCTLKVADYFNRNTSLLVCQMLMTVPISPAKMEEVAPTLLMILFATVLLVTVERTAALVRHFIYRFAIMHSSNSNSTSNSTSNGV